MVNRPENYLNRTKWDQTRPNRTRTTLCQGHSGLRRRKPERARRCRGHHRRRAYFQKFFRQQDRHPGWTIQYLQQKVTQLSPTSDNQTKSRVVFMWGRRLSAGWAPIHFWKSLSKKERPDLEVERHFPLEKNTYIFRVVINCY
jgi:hypothetical protein